MQKRQYNLIKVGLVSKGVTNKELAEHLGVSPNTVSRWCTNDQQPSIEMLFRIGEHLKIEPFELLAPNYQPSAAERKKELRKK
jgi:putative transcriptional regulator